MLYIIWLFVIYFAYYVIHKYMIPGTKKYSVITVLVVVDLVVVVHSPRGGLPCTENLIISALFRVQK